MASEQTPLLEQGVYEPERAPLPSLSHAVHYLSSHQAITAKHLHDVLSPGATPTPVTHLYAFLFAILLYMDLSNPSTSTGASQPPMSPSYNSHELIEELWTSYAESRLNDVSPRIPPGLSVQELLWTPILVGSDGNDGPEYTSGKFSTLANEKHLRRHSSERFKWRTFWTLFRDPPSFSSSLVSLMP